MSDDPFLDALNAKAGTAGPPAAPRAVRNNNPGNLRWDGKSQWQGMTGVDDSGFVKFDSPESGQRALSINIANQGNLHGINTVRGLIGKYAPPTDNNDTEAYIATVAKGLGVGPDDQIDPSDPRINTALQASITPVEAGQPMQAPTQASHDPFLAALDDATKGGGTSGQAPPTVGSGDFGGVVGADNVGAPQQAPATWSGTLKSIGSGLAAITPATDAAINGRNYFDSLRDDATGFASGVAQIPATALHLAGDVTSLTGGRKKDADTLHRYGDNVGNFFGAFASDPESAAYKWGRLGGEVGATLPVAELTPLTAGARAAKAGKFATALARYGDMAAQGAIAGAATSGGHDIAKSALYGAAFAPAVGAVGDRILPLASKAVGAVSDKAKALAAKLGASVEEVAPAASQTVRRAADLPVGNIEIWHTGTPAPQAAAPQLPASATADEIRQSLGSRGSNSGLEANPQFPPQVAKQVDQLRLQGVPLDQAIREAEISYVGAKPTIASVTRNPEDQAAVWEGAKQATPEGRALAAQIAQNNAAVVNKVQNTIQDLGGVPSQGEAAETAAASLAKASDAEKAKVSELYKAADEEAAFHTANTDARDSVSQDAQRKIADRLRADYEARVAEVERLNAEKRARLYQGGGSGQPINEIPMPPKPEIPAPPATKQGAGYIDVSDFRRALDNPEMANPTIEGVKSLRSGVTGLLDAYAGDGNKITLEQAEKLRQAINDAYDPLGSGINGHVGRLKASLDNALDSADAGPAYKAARAAHRAWAEKYDNPEGISSLIKRDAQGNFVNGDNWRKSENFIGSAADKPFIEVVNRLKENGDTAAVQRLKAAVLQRAYEKATNNATDKLGNATINGKLFLGELNRIGTAKLNALFDPSELAEISTTARAAIHMNEAVPGTNNTSNTASALAKALMQGESKGGKGRLAARAVAHGLAAVKAPIVGNIATEAVDKGITHIGKRVQAKELARALAESMNPATSRAKAAQKAAKLAETLRRREAARNITSRTAPSVGAISQERR